jgi:ATP-binding cassette subfamily B protein
LIQLHAEQELFFHNVLHEDVAFFDRTHTSELNLHFVSLGNIHFLAGPQIPSIVLNLLTLLFRGALMIHTNGFLGGIVLSLLLLQGAAETYIDKKVAENWGAMQAAERAVNQRREEAFAHIRAIKHCSAEDDEFAAFRALLDRDAAARARLVRIWATRAATGAATTVCGGAFVCVAGLRRVLANQSTVGEAASFALLAISVKDAGGGLFLTVGEALEKARSLRPALALIDSPPKRPAAAGAPVDRATLRGEVALRGVRFAYPSRPEREVSPPPARTTPPPAAARPHHPAPTRATARGARPRGAARRCCGGSTWCCGRGR